MPGPGKQKKAPKKKPQATTKSSATTVSSNASTTAGIEVSTQTTNASRADPVTPKIPAKSRSDYEEFYTHLTDIYRVSSNQDHAMRTLWGIAVEYGEMHGYRKGREEKDAAMEELRGLAFKEGRKTGTEEGRRTLEQ